MFVDGVRAEEDGFSSLGKLGQHCDQAASLLTYSSGFRKHAEYREAWRTA